MAAMAASLMCCGVAKMRLAGAEVNHVNACARSLSASATTAHRGLKVPMRLMRSVSRSASVVAVRHDFFSFLF